MALTNMKMDKEEASEAGAIGCESSREYPYGLELRLDDKSLAKLGMSSPPAVNATMTITAKVVVSSASSYQTQEGEAETSSCWQITDMEVTDSGKSAATVLYGD